MVGHEHWFAPIKDADVTERSPTYYSRFGSAPYATESRQKKAGWELIAYVVQARREEILLRLAPVRRKKFLTITIPRLYRWGRPTQIIRARKPLRQLNVTGKAYPAGRTVGSTRYDDEEKASIETPSYPRSEVAPWSRRGSPASSARRLKPVTTQMVVPYHSRSSFSTGC